MSHGAIFTRGLFRTRFTFSETPMVYTYSFPPLESRLADGSAANHTGVFTPSPFFLKVSRFKYFCPANAAKPIASLLPTGQFTTRARDPRHRCCAQPRSPTGAWEESDLRWVGSLLWSFQRFAFA